VEYADPASGKTAPLFNPRAHAWSAHFRWSTTDSTLIEPLTPTGSATVALLEMNAPHHRTIRELLRTLGRHPPAEG
jgi:hypothetical protein